MPKQMRGLLSAATLRACAACVMVGVLGTGAAAEKREHLALMLGPTELIGNQLVMEPLGLDFTTGFNGVASVRHSLTPHVDLTFDLEWITADASPGQFDDADMTLAIALVGPGVRYHPMNSWWHPFVQANVLRVSESIDLTQFDDRFESHKIGVGFGIMGGVEFLSSHRFSIPVTLQYHYARPADDVSGLGVMLGCGYNADLADLNPTRLR